MQLLLELVQQHTSLLLAHSLERRWLVVAIGGRPLEVAAGGPPGVLSRTYLARAPPPPPPPLLQRC